MDNMTTVQDLKEDFTRNTFTAMIKGISEKAISRDLICRTEFEQGIKDLYKTAEG